MLAIIFPPPASADKQVYATISALEGGHLTLPERLFVTDADPNVKRTVPSLSFLIQHPSTPHKGGGSNTKLVFDLGLKRDLNKYMPAMQTHIANRQPVITSPDVADSLRAGGLDPARDIDYVIMSHVHWDHVGTPADFERATFIVGHGTLHLVENGAAPHYPKEIFDPQLLPRDRVWEFCESPIPEAAFGPANEYIGQNAAAFPGRVWRELRTVTGETIFPAVIDLFDDGSVYLIDSPGHLFGHMNVLARVGPTRWIYLGGDCCHDARIVTGEKGIALYDDGTGTGRLRSVHVDTDVARSTLHRIQALLPEEKSQETALRRTSGTITLGGDAPIEIELIVAHDGNWREKNQHRFFPGTI
ncbi:hypothetical protein VTN31DRAFT_3269 [Thermomyces dupontii]|uniref:uncharacterized protein n=1 Tax=Talaromyces thermophilus TaxID=28565 RepID=UPI00374340EC